MTSLEGRKSVRQYVRSQIPRFRWTHDLHQSFLRAIECLGGEHKATPKLIVEIMGVNGLTVSHVKSHLQMHRNNKKYENSLAEVKSRNRHLQRFEKSRGRLRFKYDNSPISSLNKKSHKFISLYSHKRLRASEVPSSLADEQDPQRITSSEQNRTFGSYIHCTNSISALLTTTHQHVHQNAHDIIWNIKLSQAWPENKKYCKHPDPDSMPMSMYSKDGGRGEPSHSQLQLQLDHKLWYNHGEFASSMACRGHNKQESKDSQPSLILNSIQLSNAIAWSDESKSQDVDHVKLNQKPILLEDDIQLELSLSIPEN